MSMRSQRTQHIFSGKTSSIVTIFSTMVLALSAATAFVFHQKPHNSLTTTCPAAAFASSSTGRCFFSGSIYNDQRHSWRRRYNKLSRVFSSVGDDDRPGPPGSGGGRKGSWDDFLNPNNEEPEKVQKAKAYMSEISLPISFDALDEDEEEENKDKVSPKNNATNESTTSVSALVQREEAENGKTPSDMNAFLSDTESLDVLQNNPYMNVVSKLSPSDLITKFTSTAHPRVQNAVRATILGLIGNLPKMAFDTTTITTGERLASLMFQLQMTGYMFKNAEYRLSLSQSLGMSGNSVDSFRGQSSSLLLPQDKGGGAVTAPSAEDEISFDKVDEAEDPLRGKVKGKIKIHLGSDSSKGTKDSVEGSSSSDDESDNVETEEILYDADTDDEALYIHPDEQNNNELEMEVDAAAYMSELRSEVSKLRSELLEKRQAKEDALRKDLLLYIRTLPQQELRQLTNTISEDVLVGMKGLVNVVMAGIGEGNIEPNTVTEQSGEAMAQLCMWQLVVGYNLRELEVREEMKSTLFANNNNNDNDNDGSSINQSASDSSRSSNTSGDDADNAEPGTFE